MKIRPAIYSDIAKISQLIQKLTRSFIANECTEDGLRHLLNSMSVESISNNFIQGYQYFVLCHDSVIQGVVAIKGQCHIYHLFIKDTLQSKGWGKKLLSHAMETILERDSSTRITVNSSLNAVGFYQRAGFEISGPEDERMGIKSQPMRYESFHTMSGACDCGNVSFSLKVPTPSILQPRACDCEYCKKYQAVYVSDPEGTVTIDVQKSENINIEKQGSEQAFFLICTQCQQLVSANYMEKNQLYSSINSRCIKDFTSAEAAIVSPRKLKPLEKRMRWKELWFKSEILKPE